MSAITATQGTLTDLPFIDGEVKVTSSQAVRRTCSLTVDPRLWPASVFDPLSPLGSEVLAEVGIGARGGWEWIPVFRGPVQRSNRSLTAGAVTIEAAGREQAVIDDRLDAPAQTVSGALVVAEISRLITESIPTATVVDLTGSTKVAPQITIDRERWKNGVEALATAIAAEVYADPTGVFYIRPQPTLNADPVWTIEDGANGTMLDGDEELTREKVYNRVVVESSRADGSAPIFVVVSDDDPASPTRYGGPFGRKSRPYRSPLINTVPQATEIGIALLARIKGLQSTITLKAVPHPGLESGDVIEARLPDGRRQKHVLDTFNIPLKAGPVQSLTSRSLDLPSETGS